MSSPLFQESIPTGGQSDWLINTDSFTGYYDADTTFWLQPGAGPTPYDQFSEQLCLWQNTDSVYSQWSDKADGSGYSSYYHPFLYFDVSLSASPVQPRFTRRGQTEQTTHQRCDAESVSGPTLAQANLPSSFTSTLAQQVQSSCTRQGAVPSQDHRSSIARASDTYLAKASTLSAAAQSGANHENSLDCFPTSHCQPISGQASRPPSKKRSIEALDGCNVKEEDGAHVSTLCTTTNDPCCLPPLPLTVPSQCGASPLRTPYLDLAAQLHRVPRHLRHDPLLPRHEDRLSGSKQYSNKRFHQSTAEELGRREAGVRVLPTNNATWPNPDDPSKATKKAGEQKKQALACLFCRERKIACGRPSAHNPDQTCNQCARRRIKCEYPTESRRGQHKRRRKTLESEAATATTQTPSQNSARTNSASSSSPSTIPSTNAGSPPNSTPSAPG
ncbi:hypothetical protein ID866_3282 [Astraeus odoratus]|nr:hypothetical protein ID866_3282 [Astraeus odoratus]